MIHISQPYLYDADDRSRVASQITIDGKTEEVWFDVDKRYREYLCFERVDAFVLGVLFVAMQKNEDIICDGPIGDYLYYQLMAEFIPAVCSGSSRMHCISIKAQIASDKLPNKGAVGTGISCGADSLCTLAQKAHFHTESHAITHLTFFNVGANGENEKAQKLFHSRKQRAIDFCRDYGYELVICDSNIMNIVRQSHYITSTYTISFAVFCLQKLFSIYYLASSTTFKNYSLKDNDLTDSSKYDLLSCYCFSTDQLKMYTDGAELSRLEKIRIIANYKPAYKYLNVCTEQDENCCRCEKCLRTISELEYVGVLERFSDVFNLDYLHKNRRQFLRNIYHLYFTKSDYTKYYKEVWPYYRSQININDKLYVWYKILYSKIQYLYWKYYIDRKKN